MATYSRLLISASISGSPIPLTVTASPGTLLHTSVTGAESFDEVYLWVSNVTATVATLTLQWGGTSVPANALAVAVSIPANSQPIAIAVGQVLNNGQECRAFSSVASALNITGYVNRIA